MAAPPPRAPEDDPVLRAEKTKVHRKIIQEKHERGFEEAKEDVKESLYDEEGPDMREDMMDVIRQYWSARLPLLRQHAIYFDEAR